MRVIISFVFGFIGGCFYVMYQVIESPDGIAVKFMERIKTILEVL